MPYSLLTLYGNASPKSVFESTVLKYMGSNLSVKLVIEETEHYMITNYLDNQI